MKFFDDFGWWNADSRNEETRLLLDDDVDELGQLATCIIELTKHTHSSFIFKAEDVSAVGRGHVTYVCFPCAATNLGDEQVDAEWRVGVFQVLFQGLDLCVMFGSSS